MAGMQVCCRQDPPVPVPGTGLPLTRLLQQNDELVHFIDTVNSHLKCKAGFCEGFEWSEIVKSLSRSIVESVRDVCKGVV